MLFDRSNPYCRDLEKIRKDVHLLCNTVERFIERVNWEIILSYDDLVIETYERIFELEGELEQKLESARAIKNLANKKCGNFSFAAICCKVLVNLFISSYIIEIKKKISDFNRKFLSLYMREDGEWVRK